MSHPTAHEKNKCSEALQWPPSGWTSCLQGLSRKVTRPMKCGGTWGVQAGAVSSAEVMAVSVHLGDGRQEGRSGGGKANRD